MLKAYSASQAKVAKSVEQASNAKRAHAMLQKRDALNKDLQANRDNRLKQMEQAVLMVSTIHKRDRTKYQMRSSRRTPRSPSSRPTSRSLRPSRASARSH